MKGLLAGKIDREHPLDPHDKRLTYPMYQGEEWEKNLAFLEKLRVIADECGKTVAQVVINWTIHEPGITAALCGAKRPWQFRELAGALGWQLSPDQHAKIDAAISARGEAVAKRLFR
jgi:aryl-alcohol dehydrogenase-like predicted oxidoreductase